MKKYKGKKGITLIALVVTIIVLLVLAGISISMLTGQNGILSRTQEAKKENKKVQIKEKIELIIQEYLIEQKTGKTTADLKDYMSQKLSTNVDKKSDVVYWLIFEKNEIEIKDYKVTRIEELDVDIAKSYENVEEMKKDSTIEKNTIVKTNSLVDEQYGGSAYYSIEETSNKQMDGYTCITLENGLYAKLYPIKGVVTPNQFGAYGDGKHDDREALQRTFDSGYNNIKFEENQKYKIIDGIKISKDNVTVMGEKSSIITDDEYIGTGEFLFLIQAKNVNISDLKIEATETEKKSYSSQFVVFKASNINVEGCSFIVSDKTIGKLSYTNIDLYSDWHNVTIDNCELTMLSDTESGGCIWIRDIQELTADNLKFTNNVCNKKSHDEILAIFRGYIENVEILNNKFYVYEGQASPSVMNFTIGAASSKKADNVIFSSNEIIAKSTGGLVWMANLTNSKIINNKINYTQSEQSTTATYIFRRTANISNVTLEENNIVVNSDVTKSNLSIYVATCFDKCLNNTIETNCMVEEIFGGQLIQGNNITVNGGCKNIFNWAINVIENNININSQVGNCLQFLNGTLPSDLVVKGNVIDYNFIPSEKTIFFAFYGVTVGDYSVLFEGNTLKQTTSLGWKKLLANIKVNDAEAKTITFRRNNLGNFTEIYQHNGQQNNIVMEDNT